VILDDLIVDGSLCVGQDCVNGESFGFDTIRLKENNLRIRFVDTSNSASFPTRDWQIIANESANGGISKFSIEDIDAGNTPFTIEGGSRANALYVDASGRVGLGKNNPAEDLHIWYGDTPTIRLEQSGGGWTPQTWDVAGNEANFFVRDVTNGSKLPFRIHPGAQTSSIEIQGNSDIEFVTKKVIFKADGKVGIGTVAPTQPLELERAGADATFIAKRTGETTAMVSARADCTNFGSYSDHPLNLVVNNSSKATIDTDGNLKLLGANGVAGIIFPDLSKQTTAATGGGGGGVWSSNGSKIYYNTNNVGIGTNDPVAKLELKSAGGLNSGLRLTITDASNYGTIDFYTPGGAYGGLNGQFTTTGSSYANGIFTGNQVALSSYQDNGSTAIVAGGTGSVILFAAGGYGASDEKMRITGDGYVGINNTSPNVALDVSGTVEVNNVVAHSDRRWKKNIKTINSALDKVRRMRGVKFDWRRNEFESKNFDEKTHVGFIAQEVEEVVPEFVTTDPEGYKAVAYSNVTALLVEAIKDQQNIIEQQKAEIDAVNAKLAQLERAIQKFSPRQVMSTSAPVQQTKRDNISLPRVQVQTQQVEQECDENGRPIGSSPELK
jgi:hypothetical protein